MAVRKIGPQAKYNAFFEKFKRENGYISELTKNGYGQRTFIVEFSSVKTTNEAIAFVKKQGWLIYKKPGNTKKFMAVLEK